MHIAFLGDTKPSGSSLALIQKLVGFFGSGHQCVKEGQVLVLRNCKNVWIQYQADIRLEQKLLFLRLDELNSIDH